MFEFSSHFEFHRHALLREIWHGVEDALRPFQQALDMFLGGLFQGELPANWREQWQAFIVEQQTRGFTIDPKSSEELESWIEAWAIDSGLMPVDPWDDEFDVEEGDTPFIISVIPEVSGYPRKKTTAGGKSKPTQQVKIRVHLPADVRGKWLEGVKGHGTFQYDNSPRNVSKGIAGLKVKFDSGYIAVGGLPAEAYYQNSASAASVTIDEPTGTRRDNRRADAKMREKLGDPKWKRPKGYDWNHAGPPGSRVMELVKTEIHKLIAHRSYIAVTRALGRTNATGKYTRAQAVLDVYLTVRDALQAKGVLQPVYEIDRRMIYQFRAEDESLFIVYPAWLLRSPYIEFIDGPRRGDRLTISRQQAAKYQEQAEAVWGRYIPGTIFRAPRFIPGTKRSTIPLIEIDSNGIEREVGWIDENGVNRYSIPLPPYS